MIRLAILSSHPIQYNVPLFRALSLWEDLQVKLFYSWEGTANQIDPEFGKKITWDIPLLDGYEYCFVPNISDDPGTHHFRGLDNPEMIHEIEQWGAEALLVYGWPFKTHLGVLRYFHGRIPVFFRGDSTLLTGGNVVRQVFRKILLRWVYAHVDFAFYPGKRSREYFSACGLKDEQLVWIPHAVDNQRFMRDGAEMERQAAQRRAALNIPPESLAILFAGKLVSRKEPDTLLRAVMKLVERDHTTPMHLIIVGEGPLRKELETLAGANTHIHFCGFANQSQMPVIYRMGDLFVLPSNKDTWGLAVNEAMACGRAVLVSDRVGCAPDLVQPGETGDVFSCGNVEQLKEIIQGYLDQPQRLKSMGDYAQQFINAWSVETAAGKMGNFISIKAQAAVS